jgi:hypothetical protein
MSEPCTWCGAEVEHDDGYRAYLLSAATNTAAGYTGERRAVFCRLEHLIPWSIQGAHWDPMMRGRSDDARARDSATREVSEERPEFVGEPPVLDQGALRCSQCDAELGEVHVLLVRHRGEYRVVDAFCSVDHLETWAKAGGRWQ